MTPGKVRHTGSIYALVTACCGPHQCLQSLSLMLTEDCCSEVDAQSARTILNGLLITCHRPKLSSCRPLCRMPANAAMSHIKSCVVALRHSVRSAHCWCRRGMARGSLWLRMTSPYNALQVCEAVCVTHGNSADMAWRHRKALLQSLAQSQCHMRHYSVQGIVPIRARYSDPAHFDITTSRWQGLVMTRSCSGVWHNIDRHAEQR